MLIPSHAARRGRLPLYVAIAALLLLAGCAAGPRIVTPEPPPIPEGGAPVPQANEIVLADGMQLVADAPFGPIKIEAGPGLRRVISWNDVRRGVIVRPREERFAGSLGITYDGKPPVWEPAQGVTELEYEEGQRRFENIDDAKIWMQIRRIHYVYNNSGLVVGWQQNGETLKVELWQFYIDGEQPTSMPGANDSAITISPLEIVPQKMSPVLVYPDGRVEPYTGRRASAAKGADASPADDASAQASICNWFQRLVGQCPKPAPETNDTGDTGDTGETTDAPASGAPAATGSTPPSDGSEASSDTADSTPKKEEAPADEKPEAETESAPRGEIEGSTVNIRSRPTTKSDVLFQAHEGDSVVILKEERDWRYVEFDDGRKGWVANFLLKH